MSSFSKDVSKIASAPIISQILSVILTPIITRLYSPESFGIFQLFGSITAPLLVFTTMGYHSAILIAESEKDRVNLLFVSVFISILLSIFISLIFIFQYNNLNAWLNIEQVKIVVWVLPVSLLLHGLYLSLRYWNLRKSRFQQTAYGEIFRNLGNYLVILPTGLLGYANPNSLILGSLNSSISTVVVLTIGQAKLLYRESLNHVKFERVKFLIKRYKKFPIYNMPADLLSRFSSQLPVFLFAFFFSQNVIGFYSLALRILRLPVYYLGNAVGEVYYQRGALDKKGDIVLLKKLIKMTFILGLPFFITISMIGGDLFSFLFGKNWKEAGLYSQILSLYIFIKLLTSLASYLTNILEKQEINLFYNSIDIGLISISIIIGGFLNNVYISLFLILLLSGANSVIFGYYLYSMVGLKMVDFWILIRKALIIILPFVILTFIITKILFLYNLFFLLSFSILLLIICYMLLLFFDRELNELTKKFFNVIKNKIIK